MERSLSLSGHQFSHLTNMRREEREAPALCQKPPAGLSYVFSRKSLREIFLSLLPRWGNWSSERSDLFPIPGAFGFILPAGCLFLPSHPPWMPVGLSYRQAAPNLDPFFVMTSSLSNRQGQVMAVFWGVFAVGWKRLHVLRCLSGLSPQSCLAMVDGYIVRSQTLPVLVPAPPGCVRVKPRHPIAWGLLPSSVTCVTLSKSLYLTESLFLSLE